MWDVFDLIESCCALTGDFESNILNYLSYCPFHCTLLALPKISTTKCQSYIRLVSTTTTDFLLFHRRFPPLAIHITLHPNSISFTLRVPCPDFIYLLDFPSLFMGVAFYLTLSLSFYFFFFLLSSLIFCFHGGAFYIVQLSIFCFTFLRIISLWWCHSMTSRAFVSPGPMSV